MAIDLHIHSTFSDGTMSPTRLVELAATRGLSGIAITDHDSVEGVDEAKIAGAHHGVTVVSGVELSVTCDGEQMHLLGYLFHHRSNELIQAFKKLQEGRDDRNRRILDILKSIGFSITTEELRKVAGPGECGRPHIARVMVEKGWVRSINQAFKDYLGNGKVAYCPRFLYAIDEAVDILHKAGGVAVLAHPLQLEYREGDVFQAIEKLVVQGIDGIEVYYPTHSLKFRKRLIDFCENRGLLKTGGSDYHGAIRPGTTLAGGKNMSVPDEYLVELLGRTKNS